MKGRLSLSLCVVVVVLFSAIRAEAFPSKIHIYIANQIHADLQRNMTEHGRPYLTLMGAEPRYVLIADEDADAILNNVEFFRAGAVGPDNTPLPGLTDPTHAWAFAPYSQCQRLVELSETPQERAYALGCFVHGIGDNTVHHVVNYFAGQSFTFFPIAALDEEGNLQEGWLNVVRHMTTESNMVAAAQAADPSGFTPEMMHHQIPLDLVERTYWESGEGDRGFWHWYTRIDGLVARKNEALQAAQLNGFDPNNDLELTIEEIRASGVTVDVNREVIDAYVTFLQDGGSIPGYRDSALEPADYVILLPEIISDIRRLMAIAETSGRNRMEQDHPGGDCGLLSLECRMMWHLYGPDDGGASHFQQALDRKNLELDNIMGAYLSTIENLSNLLVGAPAEGNGHGGLVLDRETIAQAIGPLRQAINNVTDFPWEQLFPDWAVEILDRFEFLQAFLEGIFDLINHQFTILILDQVEAAMNEVRERFRALVQVALEDQSNRMHELRSDLEARVEQRKLEAMDLDLTQAEGIYANFPTSVLYMNAYNGSVGVLANSTTVFIPTASGFFSGPTSYDASFQLEYTQMALCSSLRQSFYPCGTSVGEMLQPNYQTCETLEIDEQVEPPVECYRYSNTEFVYTDEDLRAVRRGELQPDLEVCRRQSLEAIVGGHFDQLGSYSLSYPPEFADGRPTCGEPAIPGVNAELDATYDPYGSADVWDSDDAAGGCSVAARPASPSGAMVVALILGAALILSSRRR